MLHYYFGEGKGKTSSALGLALRALGHGKSVSLVHFFKNGLYVTGEDKVLESFAPSVRVFSHTATHWIDFKRISPKQTKALHLFFENLVSELAQNDVDVLILDEFVYVLAHGLLPLDTLYQWLLGYSRQKEVIVTGRPRVPRLLEEADYVTEFLSHKHPFPLKGQEPRPGIEF